MEGVYVLELAPGRIKVGRSGNLAARVREHERALVMTGGTARQSWLCAVTDSEVVETRALKAIGALPWAKAVIGSREVFTGITFLEAVGVVIGIAQTFPTARPEIEARDEYTLLPGASPETVQQEADLLAAVLQEMDESQVERMATQVLSDRLGLSVMELSTRLSCAGCRSVRFREAGRAPRRGWLRDDVAAVRTRLVTSVRAAHRRGGGAHGVSTTPAHTG